MRVAETEDDFGGWLTDLAHLTGWLVHHDRPARTEHGWRTAVQGDKGFPDFVLVHRTTGRALYAELKSEVGRLSPEQQAWMLALTRGGHLYRLWRPRDRAAIEAELRAEA
jgi:hypothetical protein